MGVYVFSKRALRRWPREDLVDFGGNVIPGCWMATPGSSRYRFSG